MSFLKRLFGGGSSKPAEPEAGPSAEHAGCTITPMPYQEEGQWQLCGVISKEIDGEKREHRFVRADRFAGRDEAIEATLRKARQIIDAERDRLFEKRG